MQMQLIIIAVIIYILAVWWFSLTFGLNPILQFTNSAIKHNLGFNKSKVLSVTAPLIIYEQAHQRTKRMPLYLASPISNYQVSQNASKFIQQDAANSHCIHYNNGWSYIYHGSFAEAGFTNEKSSPLLVSSPWWASLTSATPSSSRSMFIIKLLVDDLGDNGSAS